MGGRHTQVFFQPMPAALGTFRQFLAPDQEFKVPFATLAGVFVDRHGISQGAGSLSARRGRDLLLSLTTEPFPGKSAPASPVSLSPASRLRYRSPRARDFAL